MERSASELTPQASSSLLDDEALAGLARDCWIEAGQQSQPEHIDADARAAVADAVAFAAGQHYRFTPAQRVMEALPQNAGFVKRSADPFTRRLQRAVRLMAQRLFETSVYDPALRCTGTCERPDDAPPAWMCPSENDITRERCAKSLVFPWSDEKHDEAGNVVLTGNKNKAAHAIVRGFTRADLVRQPNGHPYVLTKESVRITLRRSLVSCVSGSRNKSLRPGHRRCAARIARCLRGSHRPFWSRRTASDRHDARR